MTVSFEENGYTIKIPGNDGLTISGPDGAQKSLQIPALEDLNMSNVEGAERFHGYVRVYDLGPDHDPQLLWENLIEHPAPHTEWDRQGDPLHPRESSVAVGRRDREIGTVGHTYDPEQKIVINTTQEGHILHPGMVARILNKTEDGYQIITIGVGNGPRPHINEMRSDKLWGKNAYFIGAEAKREAAEAAGAPKLEGEALEKWRERTDLALEEMTKWKENQAMRAQPDLGVSPDDIPGSRQMIYERLSENGIDSAALNKVRDDESTDLSREKITELYQLAEQAEDEELMQHLQHMDYPLAIEQVVGGDLYAHHIVGTDLGCGKIVKPEDVDLDSGIVYSGNSRGDFCLPPQQMK